MIDTLGGALTVNVERTRHFGSNTEDLGQTYGYVRIQNGVTKKFVSYPYEKAGHKQEHPYI